MQKLLKKYSMTAEEDSARAAAYAAECRDHRRKAEEDLILQTADMTTAEVLEKVIKPLGERLVFVGSGRNLTEEVRSSLTEILEQKNGEQALRAALGQLNVQLISLANEAEASLEEAEKRFDYGGCLNEKARFGIFHMSDYTFPLLRLLSKGVENIPVQECRGLVSLFCQAASYAKDVIENAFKGGEDRLKETAELVEEGRKALDAFELANPEILKNEDEWCIGRYKSAVKNIHAAQKAVDSLGEKVGAVSEMVKYRIDLSKSNLKRVQEELDDQADWRAKSQAGAGGK